MKNVAVISDTHVGSAYGLGHPDFLSEHQKQTTDSLMLYDRYCEVLEWFGKIDIVLHLGDSCESINYKGRGSDIKLEETDQIKSIVKLLRMIKGSPKFYMVEGSEYHCGPKKLDELVAEQIGAVVHPHYHTPAPPHHDILIEGVQLNIAHPITVSKSTWQYQTTPLAREQVLAVLNDNPAHVVFRGHAHHWIYCGFTEHFGAVVPGFQTKTPFQGRISPLGEYRIGAVKLEVDGSEFDWHRKLWKTKLEVLKA